MILINTQVRPSGIHGLGLFTVEPVPRGTAIWRFAAGFDQAFTPAALAALPLPAQRHVHWFAFLNQASDQWVLSGDHACFMNHSAQPNTGTLGESAEPITTVALRDIAAGEELTCDYFAFDGAAARKLGA